MKKTKVIRVSPEEELLLQAIRVSRASITGIAYQLENACKEVAKKPFMTDDFKEELACRQLIFYNLINKLHSLKLS